MKYKPDYRNISAAATNKRSGRLPLYEHYVNDPIIEKILGTPLNEEMRNGTESDVNEYFKRYCRFYKQMTYDTVSFESVVTDFLPDGGALLGENPGAIQTRSDFEKYPWRQVPDIFWKKSCSRFNALRNNMPDGMKAIGGVGNGVFEIVQDLVGFEKLCYMQIDDPQLFANIFCKVSDLLVDIWKTFLKSYSDLYAVCRFGDDLGFKTSTLLMPDTIIEHIIPQYSRIVSLVHDAGKPFLLHSCGCIFSVMDELIQNVGINAKHSNEDVIAPYDKWIKLYGDRIGLFGGIDTDKLCSLSANDVYEFALQEGSRFRETANGFALGSGNSIPSYVPVEGYLAMVRAVKKIRENEEK